MKLDRWVVVCLIIALAAGFAARPALAGVPAPQTNPLPPRPPETALPQPGADLGIAPQAGLNLPQLKAVLVVGPIDGDSGTWTLQEIDNMKLAESELRAYGVNVKTFYVPNNNWSQIVTEAQGAHFFFYRGHGVSWGGTPLNVGGLALKGKYVSSDEIRRDLRLAPGAIVMIYGCYAAGSSGGELNLPSAEAQRRVAQYSDPFFDIGAAGYYSNWFGDAYQVWVRNLFSGKTLGASYENYFDYNPATVERYTHPNHPGLAMWLDKDNWGGWQYDNAFAGNSSATLETLFGVEMKVAPKPISFLVGAGSPAQQVVVSVTTAHPTVFSWSAMLSSPTSWSNISATSGGVGGTTTLTVNPGSLKAGTYTTDLRIQSSTPGVINNDQSIRVTMIVADPLFSSFVPVLIK